MNTYIFVAYPTSNVNILNCPSVRASHPPRYRERGPIHYYSAEEKLYQKMLGSAPYCRTNSAHFSASQYTGLR